MTVRWVVEHPQDQLGTGGWILYPDKAAADTHAGTAAKVSALVPAEAVDVLHAAAEWWRTESLPAALMDDQEKALARAVNAYELAEWRQFPACDRTDLPADPDLDCYACHRPAAEHTAWRTT